MFPHDTWPPPVLLTWIQVDKRIQRCNRCTTPHRSRCRYPLDTTLQAVSTSSIQARTHSQRYSCCTT
jgi:hypothetical protein